MRYAWLFVGLLGCTEYGLGQGPNGGDHGDEGDGSAYGEGDSLEGGDGSEGDDSEGDDDGTDLTGDDDGTNLTGDGDGDDWDTGAGDDDVTWDDDGDYVPEIGEGCDEATDMDAIQIDGDGKVLVCHATGSGTNPSVLIDIDVAGCEEHRVHQGGRDGLPTSGCSP